MPLNIPDKLPAIQILEDENIFVMKETVAEHQRENAGHQRDQRSECSNHLAGFG